MSFIVAVPSSNPGGLEAELSPHFGHCDLFTLITLEDGQIQGVDTLENMPHQEGGCIAPIQLLANNGVSALVAGGMGMRPLMGFNQVGIDVFFSAGLPQVGMAVNALVEGRLPKFGQDQTCQGHHQAGGGCGSH